MTPCIEEALRLLRFADRDFQTYRILAGHPESALSAMGFHAQQCVEKSLNCVDFPPTHNLERLAGQVTELGVTLPLPIRELRKLNPYAVETRYNDEAISLLTREQLGQMAEQVKEWAHTYVGVRSGT